RPVTPEVAGSSPVTRATFHISLSWIKPSSMPDDASAFAALGLEPGADSAAIEQAYRRLIKRHHPDREGGDARRAAEINRAYRELRAERDLKAPLELNEGWAEGVSASRTWPVFVMTGLAGIGALLLVIG